MPRQPVDAPRHRLRSSRSLPHSLATWIARLFLLCATATLSSYGIYEMYEVMAGDITVLQQVFLVLFAINFIWISFAGVQALLGFGLILKQDIFGRRSLSQRPPDMQTAVLVPVYNEDPDRVAAAIRAMSESLANEAPGTFSFFILSDTNRPAEWLREEAVFHALIMNSEPACPVYYRHRQNNKERKAGNIADWVQRWGGAYEAMLVLDADSIMSAASMIELTRRLAADPGLGLLQTLPSIVRGESLYARLQQFANRLYGPVFGKGLSAWHGDSSNFWGHNAIMRTAAFASAAHLPVLTGPPPLGGHVISHDFIEAALLRRQGWGVRLETDLQESYEEPPPSLSDVMVRDRRWCQGNLQHSRFLFARGLSLGSRLHLVSGIMAYMSALFWLLLLVTGLALAVQASLTRPEYFAQPSLFPTWPVFDSARAVNLFILSMSIVLLPKALGWLTAMLNLRRCFRFGGPLLLSVSVLVEVLLSALYAPIMMLAQSRMVWEVLTGKDSGWQVQRRHDGAILFSEALRRHKWHTLIGVSVSALAWYLHADLFLWTLPVTSGLVLSSLLSWVSGQRRPGRMMMASGILRTPEERQPTDVLVAVGQGLAGAEKRSEHLSPLSRLHRDDALCAWHCAQLQSAELEEDNASFSPALILAKAKADRASSLAMLESWLSPVETMALLHDVGLVRRVQAF